jgi:hypothetical protein
MVKRNGKKTNGRRGQPRMSGIQRFQDTTSWKITFPDTGSQLSSFLLSELLPSLVTSSFSRWVVCEKAVVTMVPTTAIDGGDLLVQLQTGNAINLGATSLGVPMQPWRNVSVVNPTRFNLNYRTMGRMIPAIMKPLKVGSNSSVFQIVGLSQVIETSVTVRITFTVSIFPQEFQSTLVPRSVAVEMPNQASAAKEVKMVADEHRVITNSGLNLTDEHFSTKTVAEDGADYTSPDILFG